MSSEATAPNFLRSPAKRALFYFVMDSMMVLLARFGGDGPPRPYFTLYAVLFVVTWTVIGYIQVPPFLRVTEVVDASRAALLAIRDGLFLGVTWGLLLFLGSQRSTGPFMAIFFTIAAGISRYRAARGYPTTLQSEKWIAPGVAGLITLVASLVARKVFGFSLIGSQ